VDGRGRGRSLSPYSAGMEENCSSSREMEGCSDSEKDSVRVINEKEEEEEADQLNKKTKKNVTYSSLENKKKIFLKNYKNIISLKC